MTVDTVFDLASLTKPVATAASVAILVRRGKLRVEDPVGTYLPAFTGGGKEKVTLAHLLLHTSGLPAGNPVADYAGGRTAALEKLCALKLAAAPGERFVYSDLGYILLGEVVEKVSGQRLDAFAAKNVFEPLGMKETSFAPLDAKRLARTAPTERVGGKYLRGTVHDPRARRLGGVAGHAGLFGTADDLAVFAQALLDGGRGVFTTADVDFLTRPRKVPGGERTYGFDARTAYSGNRGKLFAGFGHTGFTGTSLWVDPGSRTAVIVLTNRVHPDGKGDVRRLRAEVATLAARAVVRPPPGKR